LHSQNQTIIEQATSPVNDAVPLTIEEVKVEEVKVAHRALMAGYLRTLEAASRTRDIPSRADPLGTLYLFGAPARLLVGAHIRRKLTEVGQIYAQLEQVFDPCDASDTKTWLNRARQGCIDAAASLPSLRLPGVFVLIPAVIGTGATLSKLLGWFGSVPLAASLLLVSAITLMAYAVLRNSYLIKRDLFLPGATDIDKREFDCQEENIENNIYALENNLFKALRRLKKQEIQIDRLFFDVVWLLLFQLSYAFASITFDSDHWIWWIFTPASALFFLGLVTRRTWRLKPRAWR
jgi:hypothetical protein